MKSLSRLQLYINTYIWNLEGWYWLICSQSSNGDADIENRQMGKGGGEEGVGEINGESSMEVYTLTYVNSQWNLLYDSGNSNWSFVIT